MVVFARYNSIDSYNSYYMGPIVLCEKEGNDSIVDGQQRITSLTLLLIYLKHRTESFMDFANELIYSTKRGSKSFNIQIPEREECLRKLYENGIYEVKEDDEMSVKNMASRYIDISNSFPEDISNEALNQVATKANLGVSDSEIGYIITNSPSFNNGAGPRSLSFFVFSSEDC